MTAPARRGRHQCWLAIEYLLVFFGIVGAYIAVHLPGGPIPAMVLAGLSVLFYLRRQRGFPDSDLVRVGALSPALREILPLWAAVSVLVTAGVALLDPDHLFDLPRHHTALWVAIVAGYPLASVYPQELIFRAFLLHRYAGVFGTGRTAAVASAAAFGFAHLLFGNVIAVVATLAGGWLFARRWQRTRSLLTVSIDHSLYGITIFTVGLSRFFYHGIQR